MVKKRGEVDTSYPVILGRNELKELQKPEVKKVLRSDLSYLEAQQVLTIDALQRYCAKLGVKFPIGLNNEEFFEWGS